MIINFTFALWIVALLLSSLWTLSFSTPHNTLLKRLSSCALFLVPVSGSTNMVIQLFLQAQVCPWEVTSLCCCHHRKGRSPSDGECFTIVLSCERENEDSQRHLISVRWKEVSLLMWLSVAGESWWWFNPELAAVFFKNIVICYPSADIFVKEMKTKC